MSVSLKKGQKISLTKENASLSKVIAALGWDEVKKKNGFLGIFSKDSQIDCDVSAVLLKNGKFADKNDLVYFGNLKHNSGAVKHMGDNLTGKGEGDDEQIMVDLSKIPPEYDKIVIAVNIYKADARQQHFGMIENAFIRIIDCSKNTEICRYDLTESYSGAKALIFGEIYRRGNEWKFSAVGQGTADKDIEALAGRYK